MKSPAVQQKQTTPDDERNFEVSITKGCEERPFWSKHATTQEEADRIATLNRRLINRQGWNHTIAMNFLGNTRGEQPH